MFISHKKFFHVFLLSVIDCTAPEKQVQAKDQVAVTTLGNATTAQSTGSGSPIVYLNDVVCSLSLLETGRPQDKLECEYFPYVNIQLFP